MSNSDALPSIGGGNIGERGDYDEWNWNAPIRRKYAAQVAPRFAKILLPAGCDSPGLPSRLLGGQSDLLGLNRSLANESLSATSGSALPIAACSDILSAIERANENVAEVRDGLNKHGLGESAKDCMRSRVSEKLFSVLVSGITGNVNVVTFAQYLVDRDVNFQSVLLARHRCSSSPTKYGESDQTFGPPTTVSSEKYAFVDFDNLNEMRNALRKLRDAPFHGGKLHAQVSERTKQQLLVLSANASKTKQVETMDRQPLYSDSGVESARINNTASSGFTQNELLVCSSNPYTNGPLPIHEQSIDSFADAAMNCSFNSREARNLATEANTPMRSETRGREYCIPYNEKLLQVQPGLSKLLEAVSSDSSSNVNPESVQMDPAVSRFHNYFGRVFALSSRKDQHDTDLFQEANSISNESVWNTLRNLFED